jgi:phage recombination protein Bet
MAEVLLMKPRLPMPDGIEANFGVSPALWRVLTHQVFPGAEDPHVVCLALDYCKERNLDVLKKPVHIVKLWDSDKEDYVEQVWPGINEVHTTAARTGQWAGIDAPVWGPTKTVTFEGTINGGKGKPKTLVETVTFPEWCQLTVYRLVGGQRFPFTAELWFEDIFVQVQKSGVPNYKWSKSPRSYLGKCTKAAALRAAFPEECGYCAEEMEGRTVDGGVPQFTRGTVIEGSAKKVEPISPEDEVWMIVDPYGEVIDSRVPTDDLFEDIPPTGFTYVAKAIEKVKTGKTTWNQALELLKARFSAPEEFRSLYFITTKMAEAKALSERGAPGQRAG